MVKILFGSQTGNAENFARTLGDALEEHGLPNAVFDMGELSPEEILEIPFLLIVTSTYGDGEPPDNASEWMSYLKFNDVLDLSHLKYAVLGLGDTYYPHFCQCAKDFDHYLTKHGAISLINRLDCDLYYEEQYQDWLAELSSLLKIKLQE